jgi:hypothetical protein
MAKICHAHCPDESGLGLVGLAVVGALAYVGLRAVAHTIETVVEVALIASAASISLALVAVVVVLVVRAHRRQARAIEARPVHQLAARPVQAISRTQRTAIEAARTYPMEATSCETNSIDQRQKLPTCRQDRQRDSG